MSVPRRSTENLRLSLPRVEWGHVRWMLEYAMGELMRDSLHKDGAEGRGGFVAAQVLVAMIAADVRAGERQKLVERRRQRERVRQKRKTQKRRAARHAVASKERGATTSDTP